MENNELTDDELFILLKGMIRQKETDKALKLANMVQNRFCELLTEINNLNDEKKKKNHLSSVYFEDECDD